MTTTLTARNADLARIVEILQTQRARAYDVVVHASRIKFRDGKLVVRGAEKLLTEDGVTDVDGTYAPTRIFVADATDKIGGDLRFMRKLYDGGRTDIVDGVYNAYLRGKTVVRGDVRTEVHPALDKKFMLRAFRGDDGGEGVARALLSPKYRIIDNLDTLLTILDTLREVMPDLPADAIEADLSESRMYVRVTAPAVAVQAPALLNGYRSPFGADVQDPDNTVWAGFVVENSEVGHGRFRITPRIVFRICKNGMTMTRDALAKTHLGAELETGQVQWSDTTIKANRTLVASQTRDAITSFLSPEYLTEAVDKLARDAGVPVSKPQDTIEHVAATFKFTDAQTSNILDHFIKGGQVTAMGVANAVTSAAQLEQDPDAAAEMEAAAADVITTAARFARMAATR